MIEALNKIINYIIDDIYINEEDSIRRERRGRKRIIDWIESNDLSFKTGISPYQLRGFRRDINKLKEIRKIYQEGLSFVKNKTKGFKKGYRELVFTNLKTEISRGNVEYARERALHHLEYIKKWKSERTYYRHLRRIRELGIEI